MKKSIAAAVLAAGVIGSVAACGPGGGGMGYANSTYCVNHMTGTVMPDMYCQSGYPGYNPMMYDYWTGDTYGHSYRTGVVIQKNYFIGGRQISPSNSTARKAAGLPASGGVKTGVGTIRSSTPAKPQSGPGIGSGGGRSTTSTTTRSTTSGGGSKSFSFGGGSSSTRSSGGSSSFGGRK